MIKAILIIDETTVILNDTSLSYLRENINQVDIVKYSSENFQQTIRSNYASGNRFFLLYLVSQDLLDNLDLFNELKDAYFICPISNVESLRTKANNLYFTLANTHYLEHFQEDTEGYELCVIYEDKENVFIKNVLEAFKDDPMVDINDVTAVNKAFDTYRIIVIASLNIDIYERLSVYIEARPEIPYNLYPAELAPREGFKLPPNVVNVSIAYPKSTAYPQINSYWNYLLTDNQFSYSDSSFGVLPLLLDINGTLEEHMQKLLKYFLVTKELGLNGFYYARALETYQELEIRYNINNRFIKPDQSVLNYIWLVDCSQCTSYKKWNTRFIQQNNKKIHQVIYGNQFKCQVSKYYQQGYRYFILDGPTCLVKQVMDLNLQDAIFICAKSTDDTIRVPGSNYFFLLCGDNTLVEEKLVAVKKFTEDHMQFLLGQSPNANIRELYVKSNSLAIPTGSIKYTDLDQVRRDSIMIHTLSTEHEADIFSQYLSSHFDEFKDSLVIYRKQQKYFSPSQIAYFRNIELRLESFLNYNTSQPFLDSNYSVNSTPKDHLDYVNFFDINAVLFDFDLDLLFKFGYMIDI